MLSPVIGPVCAQPGYQATNLELLKQKTIELNRDLDIFVENDSRPLVVYFSVDADQKFKIESLRLLIDGNLLKLINYDDISRQALASGGAQLVYSGRVSPGKHEIIAYYTSNRDYQRGTSRVIKKRDEVQYVEVVVQKQNTKKSRLQPELIIREWN